MTTIKSLLDAKGTFILIDILFNENDPSILRTLFRKIERGAYIRKAEDYQKVIERHFTITGNELERSHLFSLKGISIYNNLLTLVCKKKGSTTPPKQ